MNDFLHLPHRWQRLKHGTRLTTSLDKRTELRIHRPGPLDDALGVAVAALAVLGILWLLETLAGW